MSQTVNTAPMKSFLIGNLSWYTSYAQKESKSVDLPGQTATSRILFLVNGMNPSALFRLAYP
jgi:hypothetical protein